jgi:hypothetical protein
MVLTLQTKEGEGMKKILSFSLGLFAIATLMVPLTFAQEKKTPEAAAQEQAPTVTIAGKVSAVSDTSVTVVDDKKAEQIIAIDTNTKITRGGKAATVAEIKANDAVTVVASKGEGNALTAVTIKVG